MTQLEDLEVKHKKRKEEYSMQAQKERAAKDKVAKTKSALKKAIKERLGVDELVKRSELKHEAVKELEKLDDSEVPEHWCHSLIGGWWYGRTLRQIYLHQCMHCSY